VTGTAREIAGLNGAQVSASRTLKKAIQGRTHPLYLWQYTSATARVYLVGSVHVLKESLYPLPPQLERAFQQADFLVLEVDTIHIDPQLLQQKVRQYALLPPGQTLSTLLPPTLLTPLQSLLADQGIELSSVANLKPAMLATQLTTARLMALGYRPEFGMEQHFVDQVGTRPILELETLDQQLDLLANAPMDLQIEMLTETVQQLNFLEPIIAQMIQAWRMGNDAEFMRLFQLQSSNSPAYRAFVKRLLDERNVAMAKQIAGFLNARGRYFVLVGSAHLAGENSVVALLQRRGLVGRRQMSSKP